MRAVVLCAKNTGLMGNSSAALWRSFPRAEQTGERIGLLFN